MLCGLGEVKMPGSRSSAWLCFITAPDQYRRFFVRAGTDRFVTGLII